MIDLCLLSFLVHAKRDEHCLFPTMHRSLCSAVVALVHVTIVQSHFKYVDSVTRIHYSLSCVFPYIEYGRATFNMRGVDGIITFIPMNNGSMRIVVSL